jgi:hypothetical protein
MTKIIDRESLDEYAARIIATYRRATPDQLCHGRQWYPVARELACLIGQGNVRTGAGVLAALSSNTAWYLNIRYATQLAAGETVRTLRRNLDQARAILDGADYAGVLSGPKVLAFAANIAGDEDEVTVDRHAVRVALGEDYSGKMSGPAWRKRYEIIADAYRKAAAELGESPATVQAVCWVVQREGTWAARKEQ